MELGPNTLAIVLDLIAVKVDPTIYHEDIWCFESLDYPAKVVYCVFPATDFDLKPQSLHTKTSM